ncbi:class I SAM-dependent methyltransferase [Rhizobium leguminosarum]|uniref:class I SAM-dependent methyltransferase n=1 Tax=Rhizobium leguminosarum TaxID=384 RepID=UPI0036D97429
MPDFDRTAHWQTVYSTKGEEEVSWFEDSPEHSLDLIRKAGIAESASIVDVGGGASRLVDALVTRGQSHVTVIDLSAAALDTAKARLQLANNVMWIVSDITRWEPDRAYDLWHDRAAFHFLTDVADQNDYVSVMSKALKLGGIAIIGTFALSGPEKCSGLTVARHDAGSLERIFGQQFKLLSSEPYQHTTPWNSVQDFQFSTFVRSRYL